MIGASNQLLSLRWAQGLGRAISEPKDVCSTFTQKLKQELESAASRTRISACTGIGPKKDRLDTRFSIRPLARDTTSKLRCWAIFYAKFYCESLALALQILYFDMVDIANPTWPHSKRLVSCDEEYPLPCRNVFGYVWPAYQCFKAVESQDTEHIREWAIYWLTLAMFTGAERLLDVFVFWCDAFSRLHRHQT